MIRFEGRILAQDPRPHAITNAITNNQQDRPTPKRPETRRSHGLKRNAETAYSNLTKHRCCQELERLSFFSSHIMPSD